jgi:hypothetical protein
VNLYCCNASSITSTIDSSIASIIASINTGIASASSHFYCYDTGINTGHFYCCNASSIASTIASTIAVVCKVISGNVNDSASAHSHTRIVAASTIASTITSTISIASTDRRGGGNGLCHVRCRERNRHVTEAISLQASRFSRSLHVRHHGAGSSGRGNIFQEG